MVLIRRLKGEINLKEFHEDTDKGFVENVEYDGNMWARVTIREIGGKRRIYRVRTQPSTPEPTAS